MWKKLINLVKVTSYFQEFYSEINAATLTGAIDVIVVEQEDGTYKCSPFHVRFGKLGVLKAKEKIVDIEINGNEVSLKMKLDDTGAAFFVEDVDEEEDDTKWNAELATSPLPVKTESVATFGGRSLKLTPARLTFDDDGAAVTSEDKTVTDESQLALLETESIKKGKLNKKKRRRRNQLKHARKGSKSSLREVLLDNEMFEMDDVNDAEDELGGSEPEIGSASVPANLDLEFYRRLDLKTSLKPKLELPSSDVAHDTTDTVADNVNSGEEVIVPDVENVMTDTLLTDEVTETVYVDTSAPTFHYYSDGETSNLPARPQSPGVVSDSELDTQIRSDQQLGVGWRWGELPVTPAMSAQQQTATPVVTQAEQTQEDMSATQEQTDSGGSKRSWFGWSKSDSGKKAPEDGVYLEDVLANPDLQAKYLNPIQPEPSDPLDVSKPSSSSVHFNEVPIDAGEVLSEDDCESRIGLSLPMSPQGAKYDSDCEELRPAATDLPSLISRHLPDLAASLCGGLTDASITPDQFEAHILSYQEFLDRTSSSAGSGGVLTDPNLVIRVHEKYLSWEKAAPILLSILLYKQPLPSDVVEKIIKDGLDVNINISPEDMEKKKRDDKNRKTSSWFGWLGGGGYRNDSPAAVIKPEDIKVEVEDAEEITAQHETAVPVMSALEATDVDNSSNIEIDPLVEGRKFRKSLRLTSDQIAELNLDPGVNEVQFSVTTAFQVSCTPRHN